ncbi:Sc6p-like SM domain [Cryptosporidium ryanae]|uniref:Sc6p-like SM domain n=1 Tax=Cryptosporidium ryanae TaxID=515981 RepID=UPI003519E57E|nr:Sc6p-like SM domain [Cryptosporidium ryanae]
MVHEYIGSKITIISRNGKRYEGILHSIDVDKSTITLKDVRYFENNENGEPTPASNVFEMIVFRGSDITDLAVCQPIEEKAKSNLNIPHDPAIISITEGSNTSNNVKNQNIQQNNNNFKNNYGVKNNTESSKSSNSAFINGNKIQFGSSATSGNSGRSKSSNTMPNNRNGSKNDNTRGRQRSSYRGGNNSNYRVNGVHHQRSFVVGELKAKVNQALKAELDTEFDFSEQNKKFEKTFGKDLAVDEKSNEIKIGISGSGVEGGNLSGNGTANGRESNNAADDNSIESSNTLKVGGYNKVSGFFDSISCETLDPDRSKRSQGGSSDPQMKALREKQKMIDKETFGTSFVRPRGSYRNNNRRGKNRYNNGRRE